MKKTVIIFCVLLTSCSELITNPNNKNVSLELDNLTASVNKNVDSNISSIKINPFSVLNDKDNDSEYKYDKDKIKINDVLLNNQSIVGDKAKTSIEPDFSGKTIELSIKGVFNAEEMSMKNALFEYEKGLFNQSIVDKKPKTRILIDESIILTILSISKSEIKAKVNLKWIPDFYLKGLHSLRVIADDKSDKVFIKIGIPVPISTLSPKIASVEVLKNNNDKDDDKNGKEKLLKITGSNFMMYSRFSYSTIDGIFSSGDITNILDDGSFETVIHIPNSKKLDLTKKHTLMYATPFGVDFKWF